MHIDHADAKVKGTYGLTPYGRLKKVLIIKQDNTNIEITEVESNSSRATHDFEERGNYLNKNLIA